MNKTIFLIVDLVLITMCVIGTVLAFTAYFDDEESDVKTQDKIDTIIDTIYFNSPIGVMPPNDQPQSKFFISPGHYIDFPEETISISISKFNELLNNPEWELGGTYIKNGYRKYYWKNKKTGKIINDGISLNPPGHKLYIKKDKK